MIEPMSLMAHEAAHLGAAAIDAAGRRSRIAPFLGVAVGSTGHLASLGSGLVVAAAGYTTLGFLGMALVLAPVWLLLRRRHAIEAAAAAALALRSTPTTPCAELVGEP